MKKAKYTDEAVKKIYLMGLEDGFQLGTSNPSNLDGKDARVQQTMFDRRTADIHKLRNLKSSK